MKCMFWKAEDVHKFQTDIQTKIWPVAWEISVSSWEPKRTSVGMTLRDEETLSSEEVEPLSVRDEWEAWTAADDHSIISTEGQKACGSAFLTEMNYTYLSWSSAALIQAKEAINYEESVSVCYFVSESVNISKQAETAQFILLLFLIITSKNGIDSTVLLNCQLPFSSVVLFFHLFSSLLIFQWWESVHQADCFPAETRSGPKEEGIKGTQPLRVSWLMRGFGPAIPSPARSLSETNATFCHLWFHSCFCFKQPNTHSTGQMWMNSSL